MYKDEKDPAQVERLRTSSQRFGHIHPVIEAADGEVLSGEHRLRADPSWRRERREDLKEPLEKIAFRLNANIQRQMPDREKAALLKAAFIHYSRIHPDPYMKDFAKELGISESLVSRYVGDLFNTSRGPILKLPKGTLLSSPRLRGESHEQTIDKLQALRLTVSETTSHVALNIPNILAMKYDLHGGDELIVSCKPDRFVIRKSFLKREKKPDV